jgi:lipopolysaccharide transport system ATP-binding protein
MFSIKTMCARVIYLKQGRVVFDGPTDDGLKRYEGDSKLQSLGWLQDESALAVTEMQLLREDGQETTLFDYGKPMRIRLRYNASRRIEQPDFRISIRRSDDLHCASFSSCTDGVRIPYVEGEGEIELRTPPLKLTADLYTTQIIVRERHLEGQVIAAQMGPAFHIRHPLLAPLGYGVFHEAGEWRVSASATEQLAASDGSW